MFLERIKYFIFALIMGGGVAMLGFKELDVETKGMVSTKRLKQHLKKNHNVEIQQLTRSLYGNYSFAMLLADQNNLYEFMQYRDSMSRKEQKHLDRLIQNVSGK